MSRPTLLPAWATDANYPATADPWGNMPNKVVPGSGVIAEGFVPQNYLAAEYMNYLIAHDADWITYLDSIAGTSGIYGSGLDGACVFDTTNTFGFATLAGATYTLTRDIYCTNITLTNGAVIFTASYRIYCSGTLDFSQNVLPSASMIHNNGLSASGVSAGNGRGSGTLGGSSAGGAGNSSGGGAAAGAAGGSSNPSFNGNGGDGGSSSGVVRAGGSGGTSTPPTATYGSPKVISATPGYLTGNPSSPAVVAYFGGPGGGSGGCDGISNSGGGGGGAGILSIYARNIILDAANNITVNGGNGGNGVGNSGNGGGGGGGTLILVYYTANSPVSSIVASLNCQGGNHGTGGFGGVNGQNGVVYIQGGV